MGGVSTFFGYGVGPTGIGRTAPGTLLAELASVASSNHANPTHCVLGRFFMKVNSTPIHGAYTIALDFYEDHRGFFVEPYNYNRFVAAGITDVFVQDSHSYSKKGVLRGMHFQYPPNAMSKMVRCVRGKVYDVIVDMRRDSPTFRQWYGIELSAENRLLLYVPTGCAHGFYSLEESEIMYKCGAMHSPEHDAAIRYDDPEIGIVWPIEGEIILSERDKNHPNFADVLDRVNAKEYAC